MQKYLKVHFFNMSTVERMIPNRDMLNLENSILEFSKSITSLWYYYFNLNVTIYCEKCSAVGER